MKKFLPLVFVLFCLFVNAQCPEDTTCHGFEYCQGWYAFTNKVDMCDTLNAPIVGSNIPMNIFSQSNSDLDAMTFTIRSDSSGRGISFDVFNSNQNGNASTGINMAATTFTNNAININGYSEADTTTGNSSVGVFVNGRSDNSLATFIKGQTGSSDTTVADIRIRAQTGKLQITNIGEQDGYVLTTNNIGMCAWKPVGVSVSAWSIDGNLGTNPSDNFIGTTDNSGGLKFKVNNIQSGFIDVPRFSTSFGFQSLNHQTTSGGDNVAIGFKALYEDTNANGNTAIGADALESDYTGFDLTAIGANANVDADGYTNSTGIGANSLITGSNGIFFPDDETTLHLLLNTPNVGYVLTANDILGNASWQPNSGAPLPSGRLAIGSGTNTITNDSSFLAFSNVGIPFIVSSGPSGTGHIASNELDILQGPFNGGSTFSVSFTDSVGMPNSYGLVLPGSQGNPNTSLVNDGSGNLSWQVGGGGSGWSLIGNAGTNPPTNFIGTNDGADLNIVANSDSNKIRLYNNSVFQTTFNSELYNFKSSDNLTTVLQIGIQPNNDPSVFINNANFQYVDVANTQAAGKVLTSDASGNASWQTPNYSSGIYLPTFTGTSNVATVSGDTAQWLKVGNVVTVSGTFTISVTTIVANPSTTFDITLPVASTITRAGMVSGNATNAAATSQDGEINGNTGNNKATITYFALISGSTVWSYQYQYFIR